MNACYSQKVQFQHTFFSLKLLTPLFSGEGIHYAMEGGKIVAEFLKEAIDHGNYEKDCMYIYHTRWMERFGSDFKW